MRRATVVLGAAVAVAGSVTVAALVTRDEVPYDELQSCRRAEVVTPPPVTASPAVTVRVATVAAVPDAIAMAPLPDGAGALVAARTGKVWLVSLADGATTELLDLAGRLGFGAEGGLLSVVVDPRGEFAYLHYTDRAGTSRIVEYRLEGTALDAGSERELLALEHPQRLHNGGAMRFGPDGMLYLGFGSGGDRPADAARVGDLAKLDGKLLRISPRPSGGRPYGVPGDNPYARRSGGRPEIWATGLRNPWQFSFDPETGELWVGDVGSSCYEEVDVLPAGRAGADFGYPRFEGFHGFLEEEADDSTFPLYAYPHGADGCAVIGGVVARGGRVPQLDGAYLLADYCTDRVRWLRRSSGGVEVGTLEPAVPKVQAFAQGADGAIYLLSEGGVLRLEAS